MKKYPPRVRLHNWDWAGAPLDADTAISVIVTLPIGDVITHKTQFDTISIEEHQALLAVAVEALEKIASGLLPNGDHVDGATFEYANDALAKLKEAGVVV